MRILPIVERELRVAAFQRSTYRLRTWSVGLALLVLCYLYAMTLMGDLRANRLGPATLNVLSSLILSYCLISGLLLTSDCIGSEKRNGTLGLLFLTRLRGYDVVAGKLVASALPSLYGLVAMVPILALSLLFGGVMPNQFIYTTVALLVTLMLSLCVGLLASAITSEPRRSLSLTLASLLFLSLGVFFLERVAQANFGADHPFSKILLASPIFLLRQAWAGFRMEPFWESVGVILCLSLICFAIASILTMRWRVSNSDAEGGFRWETLLNTPRAFLSRFFPDLAYPELRRKFPVAKARSPYQWLARHLMPGLGSLFTVVLVVAAAEIWLVTRSDTPSQQIGVFTLFPLHILTKLYLSAEICRRFVDDRRTGALELLMVVPRPIASLPVAYYNRLRQNASRPLLAMAAMNVIVMCIFVIHISKNSTTMSWDDWLLLLAMFGGGIPLLYYDFSALAWMGLYRSLETGRFTRSIAGSFLRIMVPSWIGLGLLLFVLSGSNPSEGGAAMLVLLWQGLSIVWDKFQTRQAFEGITENFLYIVFRGQTASERT